MQIAKLKVQNASLLRMAALLTIIAVFAGCSDDRKAPLQTNDPVYTETIELFNRAPVAGTELTKSFTVEDTISDARLHINGFLWPDAALNRFGALNAELDSISQRLLDLQGQILNLSLKQNKTAADSAAIDSLTLLKTGTLAEEASRTLLVDSLDTRLDNRFKVSIWLDNDVVELYPRAMFLDSSNTSHVTGDTLLVWGQNFFTSPILDNLTGLRGRRMTLDLKRFYVADSSYRHSNKPDRPSELDGLPELFPITDWLTRLTPGSHTLHVRFGEAGANSQVSVNLYVIYKHAR